jgi:DHA2 family multidrug resistance protein
MAPLSGIAMVGITANEAGAAPGLFNMLRNLGGAMHQAIIAVGKTIHSQATLMAYAHAFGLIGSALVLAVISVSFLKKGIAAGGAAH